MSQPLIPPSPDPNHTFGELPSRPRKTKKNYTWVWIVVVAVVISPCLLAFAAGLLFPIFNSAGNRGAQTKALSSARQISLSCRVYADDHNGAFPPVASDANAAFQALITGGYIPDETLFRVQRKDNPWCTMITLPTNKVLDVGENYWAYFAGLTTKSHPQWPLISEAWTPGTRGMFPPGGVYGWPGHSPKALIVRVDSSAQIQAIDMGGAASGPRPPSAVDGNLLEPDPSADWLTGATPLLPAAP